MKWNRGISARIGRLTFSQILGAPAPTAAYRAANHSIGVAALSAIVGALGQQHAISTSARATLSADLLALGKAKRSGRSTAISRLAADVVSNTRGAAGTLLGFAAAG